MAKPSTRLLVMTMILVAGCIGTETQHPVSNVKSAKPMPELNGIWSSEEEGDDTEWKITPSGESFPNGMHTLWSVDGKEELITHFYITRIGKKNIVNLLDYGTVPPTEWSPKKIQKYSIFAFELNKDSLQLLSIDPKFLRTAIEDGSIKGRIDKLETIDIPELADLDNLPSGNKEDNDTDEYFLTAPTKELKKFCQENFDKLFGGERIMMRRILKETRAPIEE